MESPALCPAEVEVDTSLSPQFEREWKLSEENVPTVTEEPLVLATSPASNASNTTRTTATAVSVTPPSVSLTKSLPAQQMPAFKLVLVGGTSRFLYHSVGCNCTSIDTQFFLTPDGGVGKTAFVKRHVCIVEFSWSLAVN